MTRPNSLPLLPPPWGVQSCFFALLFVFLDFWFFSFLVFWFLFSGSLLVFLQWLNKTKIKKKRETNKTKKNDKTQLSAITPPWGVQSCFLFCFVFFFFVFWFLGFLQWLNKTKIQKKTRNQNTKKKQKKK